MFETSCAFWRDHMLCVFFGVSGSTERRDRVRVPDTAGTQLCGQRGVHFLLSKSAECKLDHLRGVLPCETPDLCPMKYGLQTKDVI